MPHPDLMPNSAEKQLDTSESNTGWDNLKNVKPIGDQNTGKIEYDIDDSAYDPRPPRLHTEQSHLGTGTKTIRETVSSKSWEQEKQELLALAKETIRRHNPESAQAVQSAAKQPTIKKPAMTDARLRQNLQQIADYGDAARAEADRLSSIINQPQSPQPQPEPTKKGFFARFGKEK